MFIHVHTIYSYVEIIHEYKIHKFVVRFLVATIAFITGGMVWQKS